MLVTKLPKCVRGYLLVCDGWLAFSWKVRKMDGGAEWEKRLQCGLITILYTQSPLAQKQSGHIFMDFHLGCGIRRSQQSRFSLAVALYSRISNFRRLKRYNVFLKYHPRFFSRGGWWRWRAWGCWVGASILAMVLNIMLMGLATMVAPSNNITAKFCFSLWLLSTHWCRLHSFCACWHSQVRLLYSNC